MQTNFLKYIIGAKWLPNPYFAFLYFLLQPPLDCHRLNSYMALPTITTCGVLLSLKPALWAHQELWHILSNLMLSSIAISWFFSPVCKQNSLYFSFNSENGILLQSYLTNFSSRALSMASKMELLVYPLENPGQINHLMDIFSKRNRSQKDKLIIDLTGWMP